MKKNSTAEYAETTELFLFKDKKYKYLYGYGLLFALRSSGDRDKRMKKEEAESAEIISWKIFSSFDLPGCVANRAAFLPSP
jgi:hypothetical protein